MFLRLKHEPVPVPTKEISTQCQQAYIRCVNLLLRRILRRIAALTDDKL